MKIADRTEMMRGIFIHDGVSSLHFGLCPAPYLIPVPFSLYIISGLESAAPYTKANGMHSNKTEMYGNSLRKKKYALCIKKTIKYPRVHNSNANGTSCEKR